MPSDKFKRGIERELSKILIAIAAISVVCGSALAQNTGPLPQSGMERPGMTNGAKEDGRMDTTGMSTAKGNTKRDSDGAPAAGKSGHKNR
jgi:hypothetical protein